MIQVNIPLVRNPASIAGRQRCSNGRSRQLQGKRVGDDVTREFYTVDDTSR
jgi:hypothetical protein